MPTADSNTKKICFDEKELAGSRLRCLMLTSQGRNQVAGCLNALVKGHGQVNPSEHYWCPEGFRKPKEVQLGRTNTFLSDRQNRKLLRWWLAVDRGQVQLPTWDIVSQAIIGNEPGLILIEAKAHTSELSERDKCTSVNQDNRDQIGKALQEASDALNRLCPAQWSAWKLQQDSHYQLSNRFAWSWKLAQMGVPVILVYLGYLNASEMADRGKMIFARHEDWFQAVQDYTNGFVPVKAWDQALSINGTPFHAMIRSLNIGYSV